MFDNIQLNSIKQITQSYCYGLIVRVIKRIPTEGPFSDKYLVKPLKGQDFITDLKKLEIQSGSLQDVIFIPKFKPEIWNVDSGLVECYACKWQFHAENIDVDIEKCPICDRPKLDWV